MSLNLIILTSSCSCAFVWVKHAYNHRRFMNHKAPLRGSKVEQPRADPKRLCSVPKYELKLSRIRWGEINASQHWKDCAQFLTPTWFSTANIHFCDYAVRKHEIRDHLWLVEKHLAVSKCTFPDVVPSRWIWVFDMLHESKVKLMRIGTLETYLTLSWSENAEMNEYSYFQIGPDSAADKHSQMILHSRRRASTQPDKPSEIED